LFTTLGASGGAAAGGPLGAALGGAAGEKLGSTASQMKRNKRQVQQLEKEIQPTKLSDIGK
jgi:outer membrane lipoprotein SlyB